MHFYKFIILTLVITVVKAGLESVNDDKLFSLISNEKYVIALFTRSDCEACDNFENELIGVRDELVDALEAWVVKVPNSQMTRLYSPTREPVLVFFRHGVPLLYHGPISEEHIVHTLIDNKEPIVKELTDDTFEHLTQAATGATTGDWFVMFYTSDCIDCQRLQARWEAVGAAIKSRINVARVHRSGAGAATARRFGIFHVPAFVLFRQGKMYQYQIQKYDVQSFVSFAQEWYKNVKGERVPHPKSPFDDLTILIADYLRDNPWLWYVFMITLVSGLLITILKKIQGRRVSKEKKEEKPKSGKKKEK